MNAKPKAAPPKENWQRVRRRYTWHLRDDSFDRSHWWEKPSDYDKVAALYELARRHPLVGETPPDKIPLPGSKPVIPVPSLFDLWPSLHWTLRLAPKTWAKLTKSERSSWESSLQTLKGLDFRPVESVCNDVTSLAHSTIYQRRNEAAIESAKSLTPELIGTSAFSSYADLTDDEWEEAIAQCAVDAHRQGKILLAVAPDMASAKAESVLLKTYRDHLRLYPPAKPRRRARWQDWLPLISVFEDAETSTDEATSQKANSQVFACYHRVVDGIHFA